MHGMVYRSRRKRAASIKEVAVILASHPQRSWKGSRVCVAVVTLDLDRRRGGFWSWHTRANDLGWPAAGAQKDG